MPEIGTLGLMSGVGKRGGATASVLAPNLDSTQVSAVACDQAASTSLGGPEGTPTVLDVLFNYACAR
jgi:hypothetical protein